MAGADTAGVIAVFPSQLRWPGLARRDRRAIARAPAELHIVWAFRESALLEVARAAAARVGIVVTANSHSP